MDCSSCVVPGLPDRLARPVPTPEIEATAHPLYLCCAAWIVWRRSSVRCAARALAREELARLSRTPYLRCCPVGLRQSVAVDPETARDRRGQCGDAGGPGPIPRRRPLRSLDRAPRRDHARARLHRRGRLRDRSLSRLCRRRQCVSIRHRRLQSCGRGWQPRGTGTSPSSSPTCTRGYRSPREERGSFSMSFRLATPRSSPARSIRRGPRWWSSRPPTISPS